MATDGTGLKVIVPELPAAHNGLRRALPKRELAVFQYEPTKSGDVVAAKLRPFQGTLTADAEHRFNDVFASGRVMEAAATRTGAANFATPRRPSPRSRAKAARSSAPSMAKRRRHAARLARDALREHRQRYIRPVVHDFERWLRAVSPRSCRPSRWRRRSTTTQSQARALSLRRRPHRAHRQLNHRARVPERRQAPTQHALRWQHGRSASRLRAPRYHRHLSRAARPRAAYLAWPSNDSAPTATSSTSRSTS